MCAFSIPVAGILKMPTWEVRGHPKKYLVWRTGMACVGTSCSGLQVDVHGTIDVHMQFL
jgi:cytochrome c oxidase assembly factor CtaG